MKHFKAIAAMSENRVIGNLNKIPWHLPEDFKWFKKLTTGNVVVMGRKTFVSLKGGLPNRTNLVLTRHPRKLIRDHPEMFGGFREWRGGADLKQPYQMIFTKIDHGDTGNIRLLGSIDRLNPSDFPGDIFICGGAEIYAQTLARCSDLYLTRVKRQCEGDAFFPPFEEMFVLAEQVADNPGFQILHYRRRTLA